MERQEFRCLFCGERGRNGGPETIKIRTRDSEHHVVKCMDCGLQQLFPLPSVEEEKRYYDKNKHDKLTTPGLSIDDIYKKFLFQNKYRVDYLKHDVGVQKTWKIMDLASGYGFFIQLMAEDGYNVDGIEISRERLELCKERIRDLPAKIYDINLLQEEIPDRLRGRYDLVTAFHIIEHIVDPHLFVFRTLDLLKPGGYLLMEMPNVANVMMDASKEFNDFFYIRDHVAYYTPSLIRKLFEDLGIRVLKQRGTQMYGIENHMNWILNGAPQLTQPAYECREPLGWLEEHYKKECDAKIISEYMYILGQKDDH